MRSMWYVSMALMLMGFIGLIGIGGLMGLLISMAGDGRGMVALKGQLPTFVALMAFLVTVGLLERAAIFGAKYYGG